MSVAIADIAAALAREGRVVLVVIERVRGSTPREAGAAMLVTPSGARGSIGGGAVEYAALERARAMLAADDPAPERRDSPLNPTLDQCCGGRVTLAFAPFAAGDLPRLIAARGALDLWDGGPRWHEPPEQRPVYVYGGGHVGAALVTALAPLPFAVRWIDARADGFSREAPEGVATELTPLPEAEAAAAPTDALHVVLTHSHALDLEIVAAVLDRGRFGFLGLIGSATKKALFVRRLRERGIPEARLARLVCPIGLPQLRDKRPAVIAASTAVQLVEVDAALAAAPSRASA